MEAFFEMWDKELSKYFREGERKEPTKEELAQRLKNCNSMLNRDDLTEEEYKDYQYIYENLSYEIYDKWDNHDMMRY